MESYRQMVLNAQEETAAAEQRQKEIRAGLGAVLQRAKKIKALKKQLEEANQTLAVVDQFGSEGDRFHWHCQVNAIIQDLELAQQH